MIEIVFEGLQGIDRTFGVIADGLSDLAVPTQAGLKLLSERVYARVEAGINPDILPESRASRKVDGSAPALIDSGEMILAATAASDGYEHSQYRLEPDGVGGQIGVDGDFHGAMRHQFGFGRDRLGRTFHEPPRAFLVFGEGDADAVVEVYDRYLLALMETK